MVKVRVTSLFESDEADSALGGKLSYQLAQLTQLMVSDETKLGRIGAKKISTSL
jgi:hypothetical protein